MEGGSEGRERARGQGRGRDDVIHVIMQIGLMGLVEMEWIETLGVLEMKDVIYTDYVTVAKRLASQLKEQVLPICMMTYTPSFTPPPFLFPANARGVTC